MLLTVISSLVCLFILILAIIIPIQEWEKEKRPTKKPTEKQNDN